MTEATHGVTARDTRLPHPPRPLHLTSRPHIDLQRVAAALCR
ncbi:MULTISPECIES: putative leader peptide [unclassified Streptomyces]